MYQISRYQALQDIWPQNARYKIASRKILHIAMPKSQGYNKCTLVNMLAESFKG